MTGLFAGLLAVAIWSVHATIVALTVRSTSSFDLTILAFALSWLCLMALLILRRVPIRESLLRLTPKMILALIASGPALMLYYFCLYYGFTIAPIVDVYVIHLTWPIFAALFVQWTMRREWRRLTPVEWSMMALAFMGAGIVALGGSARAGGGFYAAGYAMGLLSAIAGGLYMPALVKGAEALKASGKHEYDSFLVPYALLISGALASLLVYIVVARHPIPIAATPWISVLYLGVAMFIIAEMAWIYGFRIQRSSSVASLAYLTPVLSTLFLHAFADEPLTRLTVVGLVVILIANVLVHLVPVRVRRIH